MEKQRKFLLVLPLLVIPFLTMAFWALGGGQVQGRATLTTQTKGLDTHLPEARFQAEKQKPDKMALYAATAKDTAHDGVSPAFLKSMGINDHEQVKQNSPVGPEEDRTRQIQAKLALINRQISQQPTVSQANHEETEPSNVRQLKKMMETMNNKEGDDPEMLQLSKMLDQIQAIQNPPAVQPKAVKEAEASPFRAISAIVDGKQKVADGAAVRLKLTDTVTIKNQSLQKGQLLFGTCEVTNQRLLLTITNIRLHNNIIPVNLTVFSQDGMPGIPAPEAELAGSASNGADNAIQSMQFLTMDQSIGAQAAAGGVNAAKGLFSKKMRKIKVKLIDGYSVLLKINK
jgi:hypothetical protein